MKAIFEKTLKVGIPSELPAMPPRDESLPHAPKRVTGLTADERKLAIRNHLRYFPEKYHAELAKEFADELDTYGHIYVYRLRPTQYEMRAYPIEELPCASSHAAALILNIMNNLDPRVAMFPHELITYGGNGACFSNWAQYALTMKYLCEMTDEQTLALCSGHPQGLFPSSKDAPRCVITNGMMVPNYSTPDQYNRLYALGCTQYGQMTAGSFCYIGSQGIVHGTTITIKNAGRKYLGVEDMHGKVVVTSGLGGMSGAQPKAGVICKAITVIAEVDATALYKRKEQGWLMEVTTTLDDCIARIKVAREKKEVVSIGYLGNIVELWERLAEEPERLVDLGSDQTSLHDPYGGGYYPVQIPFDEAKKMISADPAKFRELVQESLCRHVAAINKLNDRGMFFWDYGNSFLLEASKAGAAIWDPKDTGDHSKFSNKFRYPSYVQDIMGDVFSLGFGPFRWICTSNDPADLETTDCIAAEVLRELEPKATTASAAQFRDNILWIDEAQTNKLVVGSQARILYADATGRQLIAQRFNAAVRDGKLRAPVTLSRDHHDVSGTDAPFRETSDVYDGSAICADMSIQNVIGDGFRGASWVAIHNGGGTGWGNVMNGGFGLVLDGSDDAHRKATNMLYWDVLNGVTRRSWAGNNNGYDTISLAVERDPNLSVTIPSKIDPAVLEGI